MAYFESQRDELLRITSSIVGNLVYDVSTLTKQVVNKKKLTHAIGNKLDCSIEERDQRDGQEEGDYCKPRCSKEGAGNKRETTDKVGEVHNNTDEPHDGWREAPGRAPPFQGVFNRKTGEHEPCHDHQDDPGLLPQAGQYPHLFQGSVEGNEGATTRPMPCIERGTRLPLPF